MRFSKYLLASALSMLCAFSAVSQVKQSVASPDGNIKVDVTLAGGITYDVYCGDELVLDRCRLLMDGINTDRQAMHYVKKERQVRKGDVVKIKMMRNGGYAAELK